jgi:DNA repair protein RecO (recombination protein O)
VLRRYDSGEADRRLILYTREQGRLDAIAKGARKGASRLAAASEPLSLSVLHLAEGRGRRYVTQFQPITSFPGLRSSYERLAMALGLVELYAAITQAGQVDPELFDLLEVSLRQLESHPSARVALIWSELRLMAAEGVLPRWERCVESDRPLTAGANWVSPTAGGLVSASVPGVQDRFEVAAEVLVGLARTSELDEPPERLKRDADCLWVLHRFWLHLAHAPLPAHTALLQL